MSDTVVTAKFVADTSSLQAGAQRVTTSLRGVDDGIKKTALSMNALKAGFLGVGAAAGMLALKMGVDAVKAAAEEEKAVVKLGTALKNVGQEFRLGEVEQFVDDLQRATGVADDDLRPALQSLVTATGDVTQAQDLLGIALDISAATGRDLTSVSIALSKASNGQFMQINRLTNGAINPAILSTKDLGLVTAELNKLYGGQAQANAETFAGKLQILTIAYEELMEAFGAGFIDGITEGADATKDMGEAFRAAEPGMREFGKTLGELGRLFSYVSPLFDDVVNTFKYAIPAALGSLAVAFPPAAPLVAYLTTTVLGSKAAIDAMAESADIIGVTFKGPMSEAARAATGAIAAVGDASEETAEEIAAMKAEMDLFLASTGQISAVDKAAEQIDSLGAASVEFGTNLMGQTPKARDFRAEVVSAFEASAKAAQSLSDDLPTQRAIFTGELIKIVASLRESGVKDKDIEAFLGSMEGLPASVSDIMRSAAKAVGDTDFKTQVEKAFDKSVKAGAPMTADAMERLATGASNAAKEKLGLTLEPELAGIIKSGTTALRPTAFLNGQLTGKSIGSGLANGISASSPIVQAAIRRVIEQAKAAADAAAETGSPSRLFARLGDDIVLGLVVGITRSAPKAKGAAKTLVNDLVAAFNAAFAPAMGPIQSAFAEVFANIPSVKEAEKALKDQDNAANRAALAMAKYAEANRKGIAALQALGGSLDYIMSKMDSVSGALTELQTLTAKPFGQASEVFQTFASESGIDSVIRGYSDLKTVVTEAYALLTDPKIVGKGAAKANRKEMNGVLRQLEDLTRQAVQLREQYEATVQQLAASEKAYQDDVAEINSRYDGLEAQAEAQIKSIEDRWAQTIPTLEGALKSATEAYDRENAVLKGLVDERNQFLTDIRSGFRSFVNNLSFDSARGTKAIQRETKQLANGITVTFQREMAGGGGMGIRETLQSRLNEIRQFTANIKTLMQRGLDPSLVRDFVSAGVSGAGDAAAALASASQDDINAINSIQSELLAEGESFGAYASAQWHDVAIAQQQAIVGPLEIARDQAKKALDDANALRDSELAAARAHLDQLKADRKKELADRKATFDAEKARIEAQQQALLVQMDEVAAQIEALIAGLATNLPVKSTQAGLDAAQKLLDGFKKKYPELYADMNKLMDRLARSMNRTATVTIRTVYEAANVPARAMGGPVQARTAYLVGEKGPEVFVPYGRGNIIPNHLMSSVPDMGPRTPVGGAAGGNTYQITVNAGVGDPREIGRVTVEAITAYERSSGRVYARA